MIALLSVSVGDDIGVFHLVALLQISKQFVDCFALRLRVILPARVVHLDADAVVVVDARQSLEDVYMHGSQIGIDSLIYRAVSIDYILSARVPAAHRAPAFDYIDGADWNTCFGRMQNDVFNRLAPVIDATTQGVIGHHSRSHQCARRVTIGGTTVPGSGDALTHLLIKRILVKRRSMHEELAERVSVFRLGLANNANFASAF